MSSLLPPLAQWFVRGSQTDCSWRRRHSLGWSCRRQVAPTEIQRRGGGEWSTALGRLGRSHLSTLVTTHTTLTACMYVRMYQTWTHPAHLPLHPPSTSLYTPTQHLPLRTHPPSTSLYTSTQHLPLHTHPAPSSTHPPSTFLYTSTQHLPLHTHSAPPSTHPPSTSLYVHTHPAPSSTHSPSTSLYTPTQHLPLHTHPPSTSPYTPTEHLPLRTHPPSTFLYTLTQHLPLHTLVHMSCTQPPQDCTWVSMCKGAPDWMISGG